MQILAIETSCDETAAAVLTGNKKPELLSSVVASQIDIHKKYGGVVPEVAARAHIESIIPVIEESLNKASTTLQEITHVAVTFGPGLVGSLVVGVETAKAISLAQNIPLVPVNHMEGHLYANFLEDEPQFPVLALVVSGGHTMLVLMKSHLTYEVLGSTRDDAAGEAFDKAAKLLNLPYPGGPAISQEALKGNKDKYNFPIIDLTEKPYRNEDGFLRYPEPALDFSFSGLKTALLTKVRASDFKKSQVPDLAASFQEAIIKNLIQNTVRALKKHQPKTLILSGGVAANKELREQLGQVIRKDFPEIHYLIPEFSLCTDNAAMIGAAVFYHIRKGAITARTVTPEPNARIA